MQNKFFVTKVADRNLTSCARHPILAFILLGDEVSIGTRALNDLLQPSGGLLGGSAWFLSHSDEPRFITQVVAAGDVKQVWGETGVQSDRNHPKTFLTGSGTGLNDHESLVPALAESLERYCTAMYSEEQFICATADELGSSALDLDTIPRCSKEEFLHPRCPLLTPCKNKPIRWVRSLSLLDGHTVYVPAIMVYLYTGTSSPSERIWLPITTGCAAHTSYENALLSGILEVIERDAISLVWLQKLALPRIHIDSITPFFKPYWEQYQRSSVDLEYIFFDATMDLGVPTVYGLQISRTNRRLATLVSCSTAMEPVEAVAKVMRDLAASRILFRTPRSIPDNWDDFTEVSQGASFMALSEHAQAFDFLLESPRKRNLCDITSAGGSDPKRNLQLVLERLRSKQMNVYAVDLTTDEALRSGINVVRIIIPGLQPFSFRYRARYLGHPRVYEAPKQMGYPVNGERQLNHWPQPFA